MSGCFQCPVIAQIGFIILKISAVSQYNLIITDGNYGQNSTQIIINWNYPVNISCSFIVSVIKGFPPFGKHCASCSNVAIQMINIIYCLCAASDVVLGDGLVLLSAVLYAVSNVCQEYTVKNLSRVEFLGMMGLFGTLISGIQLWVIV